MDAACTIQDSIHVFSLVRKYVSRILGTYHRPEAMDHRESHGYRKPHPVHKKAALPTGIQGMRPERKRKYIV